MDLAQYSVYGDHWCGNAKSPEMFPPCRSPHALNHEGLSPFDPAFPTHAYESMSFQDHLVQSPPPAYPYSALGSSKNGSSRDNFFPWTADPENGDIIDPGTKEERMKMLEAEFGGKQLTEKEEREAERRALIGTVNEQGELITAGPKKRLAMRWVEVLLALGVSALSIYLAVVSIAIFMIMSNLLTKNIDHQSPIPCSSTTAHLLDLHVIRALLDYFLWLSMGLLHWAMP